MFSPLVFLQSYDDSTRKYPSITFNSDLFSQIYDFNPNSVYADILTITVITYLFGATFVGWNDLRWGHPGGTSSHVL